MSWRKKILGRRLYAKVIEGFDGEPAEGNVTIRFKPDWLPQYVWEFYCAAWTRKNKSASRVKQIFRNLRYRASGMQAVCKYGIINFGLAFIGRHILDADVLGSKSRNLCASLEGEDVSDRCVRGYFPRKECLLRWGWVDLLEQDEDGTIQADDEGLPVIKRHEGFVRWYRKE